VFIEWSPGGPARITLLRLHGAKVRPTRAAPEHDLPAVTGSVTVLTLVAATVTLLDWLGRAPAAVAVCAAVLVLTGIAGLAVYLLVAAAALIVIIILRPPLKGCHLIWAAALGSVAAAGGLVEWAASGSMAEPGGRSRPDCR
jgi:hypothetical protein